MLEEWRRDCRCFWSGVNHPSPLSGMDWGNGRNELTRLRGGCEITNRFQERDVEPAGLRVQHDKRNQEDNRRR